MTTANGYTLVEMLVAMTVLGLSAAAIVQTTQAFGASSKRAIAASTQSEATRRAERFLARSLGAGPYGSASGATEPALSGTLRRIEHDCPEGTCRLSLDAGRIVDGHGRGVRLARADLRFRFIDRDGQGSDRYPLPGRDAPLRAIAVLDGAGRTVAIARLRNSQEWDCAFNEVSRRCFPKTAAGRP